MLKNNIHITSFSWTKFVLRLLALIVLIGFIISCKSTKTSTNNQLNISKETVEKTENTIRVNQISLDEFELTFHTADPLKPVKISDGKGNTQKFENVKKATLKKKTAQKKDSTVKENKTVQKKEVDKSIIKEKTQSVSDTVQYKWISISIAVLGICILIIYLVRKFKK